MKHIIPISVAFVIVTIVALIAVKEFNRGDEVAQEPVVVKNSLKTNTQPAHNSPLTQTLINAAAKALIKVPDALPNNLSEAMLPEEQEDESYQQAEPAYYPESMNSFGSMNYQNLLEEYYGADLIQSFDFSDNNPQWKSLADSTIKSFAKEALGKDLTDAKVDHLRSVFTEFINRNLAEAFAVVDGQPKTPEELNALKDQALREFDQIMQQELETDIRDFLSALDPEIAEEILQSIDS